MDSACHQIANMVVNYAARRRFAAISYDDSERSFLPQFQWFKLAAYIKQKCNEKGIELQVRESTEAPNTNPVAPAPKGEEK